MDFLRVITKGVYRVRKNYLSNPLLPVCGISGKLEFFGITPPRRHADLLCSGQCMHLAIVPEEACDKRFAPHVYRGPERFC